MINYSALYKILRMSNLEIKVSFSKCIFTCILRAEDFQQQSLFGWTNLVYYASLSHSLHLQNYTLTWIIQSCKLKLYKVNTGGKKYRYKYNDTTTAWNLLS